MKQCPRCKQDKMPEYESKPVFPMTYTVVAQCTGCGFLLSKQLPGDSWASVYPTRGVRKPPSVLTQPYSKG